MDLLGDIIEKDTSGDSQVPIGSSGNVGGFPELYKPTKISSWKQRIREKNAKAVGKAAAAPAPRASEAESIHKENVSLLQNMSEEEIAKERQELMESLDPKLVQSLLRNINKRASDKGAPLFAEIEGASGTWIGGTDAINDLVPLDDDQVNKALGVAEEKPEEPASQNTLREEGFGDNDEDDIAPLDFQMAQAVDHMSNEELLNDVHFITQDTADRDSKMDLQHIDLHDPDFNEKLYEKFFPDLPKDVQKLKWMENLDDSVKPQIINDVTQCRFDFNGNLVPPTREISSTTHSALHHHSDDPELAGYTIPELQRLSRSTFPGQRSIALQTLGRILYKLGKQSYYQLVPEVDLETYKEDGSTKQVMNKIYAMFWDLCKDCRIIDCLREAADETKTRHLSIRNYAVDALWLWKKGGGDFRESQPIGV